MYSDVIEIDKIPPKQNVEYYRKVQKTTSRTVYEDGKKPQHKEETKTYVERSNNLNQNLASFHQHLIIEIIFLAQNIIIH